MAKLTITSADRTDTGISKRAMLRIVERKDKYIKARDVQIGELKAMLYEYGELSKNWQNKADEFELQFIRERKKVIVLSSLLLIGVIGSLIGVIVNG